LIKVTSLVKSDHNNELPILFFLANNSLYTLILPSEQEFKKILVIT